MKTGLVGLYTADGKGMKFSNLIGVMQLDKDRSLGAYMLRIYDIETLALFFEIELYYAFQDNYRCVEPNFYVFEYPNDGTIGLLFRN